MTTEIPSFNVRELVQPVNDLADSLEFHLGAHISPQLTPLAESLIKTLQGMFNIPTPPGEKHIHYADGTLIGTLTPLDIDKPLHAEVWWKEKDGNGLLGYRLRIGDHQKSLYLEQRNHPLLSDLYNLDQCVLAALAHNESSLKLFSSTKATADTVTVLRTIARRLRGSANPSKQNMEQPALAGRENAHSPADKNKTQADPKAPYMPATWFKDEFGLTAEALRGHVRRGNLAVKKRGRWNQYSVPDAKVIWPADVTYDPEGSE